MKFTNVFCVFRRKKSNINFSILMIIFLSSERAESFKMIEEMQNTEPDVYFIIEEREVYV